MKNAKGIIKKIIISVIVILLIVAFFAIVIKAFNLTVNAKQICTLVLIVLAVILAIYGIAYLRAIIKQSRFMRKLRKFCAEKSIGLDEVKKPYASVFRRQKGYNFSVRSGGKEFRCKIVAGVWRGSPLTFSETGEVICRRTIRLYKIEMFDILTKIDCSFESDTTKILIVIPTPFELYVGKNQADNADMAGKYQIFTARGFIGALDRNCLGASVKF